MEAYWNVCLLVEFVRWSLRTESLWDEIASNCRRCLTIFASNLIICNSARISWTGWIEVRVLRKVLWTNFRTRIYSTPSLPLLTNVNQFLSIISSVVFGYPLWRLLKTEKSCTFSFQIETFNENLQQLRASTWGRGRLWNLKFTCYPLGRMPWEFEVWTLQLSNSVVSARTQFGGEWWHRIHRISTLEIAEKVFCNLNADAARVKNFNYLNSF